MKNLTKKTNTTTFDTLKAGETFFYDGFNWIVPSPDVRTWTRQDGLGDNSIFDIGFDRRGGVWLGSARGVDAICLENGSRGVFGDKCEVIKTNLGFVELDD